MAGTAITNATADKSAEALAKADGAEGNRTHDLLIANQPLSQLSYGPMSNTISISNEPPDGKEEIIERLEEKRILDHILNLESQI